MNEKDIKKIFLFFYYNFLSVDKAVEFSQKITLKTQLRTFKSLSFDDKQNAIHLIKKCIQTLHSAKERMTLHTPLIKDLRIHHFSSFHNDVWRDFIRTTPEDEYLALIWLHVIKLDLSTVAMALNISEGTLRYRVSRALKKLVEISR